MTRLYVSETTIANMLGHDRAWLRANSEMLERAYGFPQIDPAIGKRHAPSVEQWALERNRPKPSFAQHNQSKHKENYDAL